MTLPRPDREENLVDFLLRFMSDFNVILEFSDNVEQMTAVAEAIFNTEIHSNAEEPESDQAG